VKLGEEIQDTDDVEGVDMLKDLGLVNNSDLKGKIP
jgi:hypothetical protein